VCFGGFFWEFELGSLGLGNDIHTIMEQGALLEGWKVKSI
jgi:hypothetical protein